MAGFWHAVELRKVAGSGDDVDSSSARTIER
jgi:hypothetical protein